MCAYISKLCKVTVNFKTKHLDCFYLLKINSRLLGKGTRKFISILIYYFNKFVNFSKFEARVLLMYYEALSPNKTYTLHNDRPKNNDGKV